jgi:hypothetical protein
VCDSEGVRKPPPAWDSCCWSFGFNLNCVGGEEGDGGRGESSGGVQGQGGWREGRRSVDYWRWRHPELGSWAVGSAAGPDVEEVGGRWSARQRVVVWRVGSAVGGGAVRRRRCRSHGWGRRGGGGRRRRGQGTGGGGGGGNGGRKSSLEWLKETGHAFGVTRNPLRDNQTLRTPLD